MSHLNGSGTIPIMVALRRPSAFNALGGTCLDAKDDLEGSTRKA